MTTRHGQYRTLPGEQRPLTYAVGDDARREVVELARRARTVGVDIETNGLAEESYEVKVIIIADEYHACVLDAFNPDHLAAARDALAAADVLVFHNSPFDVPPLYHAGAMTLDDVDKVVDTLIYANMAITNSFGGRGLADLERTVLKVSTEDAQKDRFKQWCKINGYSLSEGFKKVRYEDRAYVMYAGYDAIMTRRLLNPLLAMGIRQMTDHPFGRYGSDHAQAAAVLAEAQIVNRVVLKRTCVGLACDHERLQQEQDRLIGILGGLEQLMKGFGVERPTAAADLIGALDKAGVLPEDHPTTKKTGKPSTAKGHLAKIDHPAARAFSEYEEHNRLLNYLESARKIAERTDGRLHPIVGIMRAVTGRMAYGNPALQQFIVAAREMIMFDDVHRNIIDGSSNDWSQIEPVLMANFSMDTGPLEAYETGGDMYDYVSSVAGVKRKPAKVGLLSTAYGAQRDKIAMSLGISTDQADDVLNGVAKAMPRSWRLIGWSAEWTRVTGKTFTLAGRIIDVSPEFSYKGTNYMIQGSGYDLLSSSIAEGHRRGMDHTFYLAFHDELITSRESSDEWKEIMSTPSPRMVEVMQRTPVLRVDSAHLGERWRTPPDKPCAEAECASEKSLRWVPDEEGWRCGIH